MRSNRVYFLTPESREQLRRLCAEGKTVRKISEITGVPVHSVSYSVKAFGFRRPKLSHSAISNSAFELALKLLSDPAVLQLLDQRKSCTQEIEKQQAMIADIDSQLIKKMK